MDAMEMGELEQTKADFAEVNRNLQLCLKALTHDGVTKVRHDTISPQVLQVLVIGDEQDATDDLVGLVCHWGHGARGAHDGLTALRVAAAQHPNVVLLKMEMPFMNGCQIARQLRVDYSRKQCLVIGLIGRADAERRRQCWEAGIDLLLIRPVDQMVVETLLMLESVLVNRSCAETMTGFANDGQS